VSTDLKKLRDLAMQLPIHQRAELARNLISSLDDLEDQASESLWLEEAARRFEEFERGKVSARPAADVMKDARARLQ
jgi:putative addiction module component (TIGR02574 family)